MLRRDYQWWGHPFLSTPPGCSHTAKFWQRPQLTTKIVSAHLHLCWLTLLWTKWQMQREKRNPMEDLAGLDGKSVNTRRSPKMTNCSWAGVSSKDWRNVGQSPTDAQTQCLNSENTFMGEGQGGCIFLHIKAVHILIQDPWTSPWMTSGSVGWLQSHR